MSDERKLLPYASELYGVFQPVLGWKARMKMERLRSAVASAVELAARERFPELDPLRSPGALASSVREVTPSLPPGFRSGIMKSAAADLQNATTDGTSVPTARVREILTSSALANHLEAVLTRLLARSDAPGINADSGPRIAGPATPPPVPAATIERFHARLLDWLVAEHPATARFLLAKPLPQVPMFPLIIDPLDFDPAFIEPVLSPVGLLQIHRQYFFDLESFLGPPVGHVWVAPGSTVELVETSTRRNLQERATERTLEVTTRTETETGEQDELSESLKKENSEDQKLGVSSSASANFGVFQGSASSTVNLETASKQAQEHAHKRVRQQTVRVSNEIRSSYRTSFRTVTEVQDTSSRRYVLENNTENLVNYELRRKMRRIGVQLQHVGTQLCWQLFLDDPGSDLRVPTLVHVASPSDATGTLKPPDPVMELSPEHTSTTVDLPFVPLSGNQNDEWYADGAEVGGDARIKHVFAFNAIPPKQGYWLKDISVVGVDKVEADDDVAEVEPVIEYVDASAATYNIQLRRVHFHEQSAIRLRLSLLWWPPDQSAARSAFNQQMAEFKEAQARAERRAYVEAVRERVKAARDVAQRPADDLRAEERTVIYRRVVAKLLSPRSRAAEAHVLSEYLSALFDFEQALYFVAPHWWRPRDRTVRAWRIPDPDGSEEPQPALDNSRDAWEASTDATPQGRYFVTEHSRAAPLGASLGWTLQLDGDDRRNAFLNTPWAKIVIPIRPGRERTALRLLQLDQVEGVEGLDAMTVHPVTGAGIKVRDLVLSMADELAARWQPFQPQTEEVFESGFRPIEGGFRPDGTPGAKFSEWKEILPTDQIVAVPYRLPDGSEPTP